MKRAFLKLWSAALLLLLLLRPGQAADAAAASNPSSMDAWLSYAEDPSRLELLGDLTVGGTASASVCLCTDRDPSANETCVELSAACARPSGPDSHALPAKLSNGHQVRLSRGACRVEPAA